MAIQGRSKTGKFEAKSDEPRTVRTMRLTDSAWEKLGVLATARDSTRADLIEDWASKGFPDEGAQLDLFASVKELIGRDTRKTGTELAHRLGVSSAALTNWIREGLLAQKTQAKDPDGISWDREQGSKKYRPVF